MEAGIGKNRPGHRREKRYPTGLSGRSARTARRSGLVWVLQVDYWGVPVPEPHAPWQRGEKESAR